MGSLISTGAPRPGARLRRAGPGKGAEVVAGGAIGDGTGAFYPPTVLAGVDNAMAVAQEEIFGPVVTVIPFEDEKDAIRIANDVRYGLIATVWTGDPARGHRVAAKIKSGHGRDQHAVHRVPRHPVRRLQAVGLRRVSSAIDTLELYLETKSVLVLDEPGSRSTRSGSSAKFASRVVLRAWHRYRVPLASRQVGLIAPCACTSRLRTSSYAIGGGVGANRVAGTEGEDRAHQRWRQCMRDAGLDVEVDVKPGTHRSHRGAERLTGSHLDPVPHGGKV